MRRLFFTSFLLLTILASCSPRSLTPFPDSSLTLEDCVPRIQAMHDATMGLSAVTKDRPFHIGETGRQGYYEASYSPLHDPTGAIIGGIGIIRDITERRRAEEESRILQTISVAVNAAHLTAVMLKEVGNATDLAEWLKDKRLNTFVLGPGFGVGKKARDFALMLCDRALVLDADGLTSFKEKRAELFDGIARSGGQVVMTPHEGEFARLFPEIAADNALSKIEKAQAAAKLTKDGKLLTVAGGGDTVAALAHAGVLDDFSYVSTAGGAFLEWLEGKTLPGVKVLEDAA